MDHWGTKSIPGITPEIRKPDQDFADTAAVSITATTGLLLDSHRTVKLVREHKSQTPQDLKNGHWNIAAETLAMSLLARKSHTHKKKWVGG